MVECPGYVKRGFKSEEEETESVNPWKTMESAPRDGTRVLIYIIGFGPQVGNCDPFGEWQFWEGICDPTQWMPIPKPPKKNHYCSSEPLNLVYCTDDLNEPGLRVVDSYGWFKAAYCPFCGEKADE